MLLHVYSLGQGRRGLPSASRLNELRQVVDGPGLFHESFMTLKCQTLPVRVHSEAGYAIEETLYLRQRQETEFAGSAGERHLPEPYGPLRGLRLVGERFTFVVQGDEEPVSRGHPNDVLKERDPLWSQFYVLTRT